MNLKCWKIWNHETFNLDSFVHETERYRFDCYRPARLVFPSRSQYVAFLWYYSVVGVKGKMRKDTEFWWGNLLQIVHLEVGRSRRITVVEVEGIGWTVHRTVSGLCPTFGLYQQKICFTVQYASGITVAQWLRCCATNRKVTGSIPDGVIGIFHWHNPSDHTMSLGLTQPPTEMSTRRISCG